MRFLGIDFGWQEKPSGLAVLDWNGHSLCFSAMERRNSIAEVLAWVDEETLDQQALIAVDAPIIVRNTSGMRGADRLMHTHFGKYHAGAYPANLQRPFAALTTRLGEELLERNVEHADSIIPRKPGRFQIEVFPHAAIVELFDLDRIIKYKKGLVASRFQELKRYRDLLRTGLPRLNPSLTLSSLPSFEQRGPQMKNVEDQFDAVICAYVGAYWWYWGDAGSHAFGSAKEGYIVVPRREFVLTHKA